MSNKNTNTNQAPQGPIATVSKDYNGPVSFASATLETGRFEIDDASKYNAFQNPKHGLKKCMHSYQSLPAKTRQTLRITLIAVVSAITLVAIFYIARIADNQTPLPEVTVPKETFQQNVELRQPLSDLKEPYEVQEDSEGSLRIPVEVFKDMQGKAREYDKMHEEGRVPKLAMSPRFEVARKKSKRVFRHPANATEIQETLEMVRKNVDMRRKEITSKELRLWEPGTEPMRVLIVSTWRSGSTFLSQIIQSHPGVFQHYEPLSYLGVQQVRSGKSALEAQQLIHQLLDCNYKGADAYMTALRKNPQDMVGHNKDVFKMCKSGPNPQACHNETFLASACKMFPIQTVKTVRMRLNMTQLLLNDEKLRAKVVFLVRDPRGTMSSRYSSVSWCNTSPDCASPSRLCEDIQGDLKVAAAFQKLYPDRFTTVKYEDISSQPEKETRKLFSFLGLEYTDSTIEFLEDHTKRNLETSWSTSRKSSDRISLWKKQLPLEEIHDVQNSCGGVIKSLNYEMFGE